MRESERVKDVSCECVCVICLKNVLPVFEDLDLGSGQGQNQEEWWLSCNS